MLFTKAEQRLLDFLYTHEVIITNLNTPEVTKLKNLKKSGVLEISYCVIGGNEYCVAELSEVAVKCIGKNMCRPK